MKKTAFNRDLLNFLNNSPTPFHTVVEMKKSFELAGFTQLSENEVWSLEKNTSYYITRNDSSIIAFHLGSESPVTTGFRMAGAHTDSPCLKVKPNPEIAKKGYVQLGVEVYGGVLLNPWFDRDLSLAGRVTLRINQTNNRASKRNELISRLINFEQAIAIIPSLAIHLDKGVNDKRTINKQTDLPPLLCIGSEQPFKLNEELLKKLVTHDSALKKAEILEYELMFYDTQPAAFVGLKEEFIASARLDNLLSCYTGMQALLDGKNDKVCQLIVCNDHEEVGSGSTSGARGNFLRSVLDRIAGSDESYARMIANSMMVSTDNAHGIHPNYSDRHDGNHEPMINAGPAIKVNSNQSYASNSETIGIFKQAAKIAGEATQSFVTRTDLGCGSTIGPITATTLGVRTIDVGVPTFGMHSIRELAGSDDAYALYKILQAFNGLENLDVMSD